MTVEAEADEGRQDSSLNRPPGRKETVFKVQETREPRQREEEGCEVRLANYLVVMEQLCKKKKKQEAFDKAQEMSAKKREYDEPN